MKIGILGAGITGLTAGFRLSKLGHQVSLLEKQNFVGGLAAGFKQDGWHYHLENFFHHLFTSDDKIINLIRELGLSDKLFFTRAKTGIYFDQNLFKENASSRGNLKPSNNFVGDLSEQTGKNKNIFQFDSPLSLLKFSPLPLSDRLRTGLVTLYLRSINWKNLEKFTAFDWLKKFYGEKAFKVLWEPLLLGKFGPFAKEVNMAWFWARIKKRSAKLGYLEGGFQTLIDKLEEKIKENGGKIFLNTEIKIQLPTFVSFSDKLESKTRDSLKEAEVVREKFVAGGRQNASLATSAASSLQQFDKIIITTPVQEFFPEIPAPKMLGSLVLILFLKEQFLTDGTYWLNINDPGFPFVAVVEHTNLVNPVHYGGNHIVYVGGYYPQTHRYFKLSKKQIFAEFLPFLQKINPNYNLILNTKYLILNTSLYAQPVMPVNYSRQIPPHRLSFYNSYNLYNCYLANMQQVYPWDRGTNYAVELGEKIAKIVLCSN